MTASSPSPVHSPVCLVLDTTAAHCQAGLFRSGGHEIAMLALKNEPMRTGHGERLIPMIEEVLAEAGLDYDAVDRIGVATGPGSFAGIRIAIAAARGLGVALGVPVLGFSDLHVHERAARALLSEPDDRRIVSIMAGPRNTVFWRDSVTGEDQHDAMSVAAARIPDQNIVLAGEAVPDLEAALSVLDKSFSVVSKRQRTPSLASLAALTFESKPEDHPPTAHYLRPPDAIPAKPAGLVAKTNADQEATP